MSDATPQTISDSDVEFRDTKCVYLVHNYNFLYQHVCVFVCLCVSVPIIATAVQEELETGSASSGDASCATSTVKHTQLMI